jgi:hypothetical protein
MRTRHAEEDEEEERAHYERVEQAYGDASSYDPHTAPAEVAREGLRHALRSSLTLSRATIATDGERIEVPVLRVQIRQIAGWWLIGENDPNVQVHIHDTTPPAG